MDRAYTRAEMENLLEENFEKFAELLTRRVGERNPGFGEMRLEGKVEADGGFTVSDVSPLREAFDGVGDIVAEQAVKAFLDTVFGPHPKSTK
ncbi:MAG: hypothetical protein QGH66_00660 [Dehalococcoidia bacterium]|jgi:hypothetical protein|nr:hypothetical protein [Dehalococcoidia bacterium]MDP7240036.1 hypothetical protein [Dehalococcoidia bacterium]MDP7470603.1 hypothetical protein [Dehalococcoidia bacterium]